MKYKLNQLTFDILVRTQWQWLRASLSDKNNVYVSPRMIEMMFDWDASVSE